MKKQKSQNALENWQKPGLTENDTILSLHLQKLLENM